MTEVQVSQIEAIIQVEEIDGTVTVLPDPSVQTVVVDVPGPRGLPGEKGDKGDTGPTGGGYTMEFDDPSDTWIVPHGLGRRPSGIQPVDSTGAVFGAEVTHDSINQFRILIDGAQTGWITYS